MCGIGNEIRNAVKPTFVVVGVGGVGARMFGSYFGDGMAAFRLDVAPE